MNDFDEQINNAFYGVGQAITPDAIRFMQTFNRMAKGTVYTCVTAWQKGDSIYACIKKPHADGGTEDGIQRCAVDSDYEAKALSMIDYYDNPPKTLRPAPEK
jgi:hypothetical protein